MIFELDHGTKIGKDISINSRGSLGMSSAMSTRQCIVGGHCVVPFSIRLATEKRHVFHNLSIREAICVMSRRFHHRFHRIGNESDAVLSLYSITCSRSDGALLSPDVSRLHLPEFAHLNAVRSSTDPLCARRFQMCNDFVTVCFVQCLRRHRR